MTVCSWCLAASAVTQVHASDACLSCAEATARERVQRWLHAVAHPLARKQAAEPPQLLLDEVK